MSRSNSDQTSEGGAGDSPTTSFRTDFLRDLNASTADKAETGWWGAEELPRGSARVVVKRGPNTGSQFSLDQPVTTVGREAGSDIFLDDVTVSRRHAEFRRQKPGVEIVDLDSLNGTYVNGSLVQSGLLADGDRIAIGKYRLVFRARRTTG